MWRYLAMMFLVGAFSTGAALAKDAGDPERGAKIWKKCAACHQVGDEAKHKVGPHLNDIVGRTAGALDDFKFSQSMADAGAEGLVWTTDSLDKFLTKPKDFIKKTNMKFFGLKMSKDRQDIIAFLHRHSQDAGNATTDQTAEVDVDPVVLALVGDPEYGEYLASECLTCHKADGAADGMPSITGWPTEIFVIVMHAYKEKARKHPVMQMMAGKLSNEEIAALAAYFEKLE